MTIAKENNISVEINGAASVNTPIVMDIDAFDHFCFIQGSDSALGMSLSRLEGMDLIYKITDTSIKTMREIIKNLSVHGLDNTRDMILAKRLKAMMLNAISLGDEGSIRVKFL